MKKEQINTTTPTPAECPYEKVSQLRYELSQAEEQMNAAERLAKLRHLSDCRMQKERLAKLVHSGMPQTIVRLALNPHDPLDASEHSVCRIWDYDPSPMRVYINPSIGQREAIDILKAFAMKLEADQGAIWAHAKKFDDEIGKDIEADLLQKPEDIEF